MNKLDLLTMIAAGAGAGLFALGYALGAFTGAEFAVALAFVGVILATVLKGK